jgi:hypothetical protein
MEPEKKLCAACSRKSAPEMLVCQNCQRPFLDEVDTYLLLFGGALSFVLALIWAFSVDYTSSILAGVAIYSVVIMSGLVVIKMTQKFKNPERQVLKEVFYNIYQSRIYRFFLLFSFVYILGLALEYIGLVENDFINATDQYSLVVIKYLDFFFYIWAFMTILICRRELVVLDQYSYLVKREYESFDSPFMLAKQYKQEFRIYVGGQSRVVDRSTFQPLGRIRMHEYSKDKNGIYCDVERVLPDADIETFELLSHSDERHACYGRDKHAVYYLEDKSQTVLPEVNAQHVQLFHDGLLLAADHLYKKGKRVLEIKDPDSFEMLDDCLARDSMYLYYIHGDVPHIVDGVNPELMTVHDGYVFENGKSYCASGDQFKRCELATEDQLKEWLEVGVMPEAGYLKGLELIDMLRRSERSADD